MDGDQTNGGFLEAGLAQIPPALQAVADAGDLSGFDAERLATLIMHENARRIYGL